MKEDNNIEKLFRDSFENFEVAPPVSVKAAIDKQLETASKRRFLFWWFLVAILFVSGIVFAISKLSGEDEPRGSVSASDTRSAGTKKEGVSTFENREDDKPQKNSEIAGNVTKTENGSTEATPFAGPRVKTSSKMQLKHNGNEEQHGKEKTSSAKTAASFRVQKIRKGDKEELTIKNGSFQTDKSRKKTGSSLKKGRKPKKEGEAPGTLKDELPVTNKTGGNLSENTADNGKNNDGTASGPKTPADSLANVEANSEKNDSVPVSAQVTDSVQNENENEKRKQDPNLKWMVEVYGGPRFGRMTSKSDFTLKDANSWQIGLGFSRSLNLGPLKYVTLTWEYGSGKENYTSETQTESIYFAGIDSIPYFDSITGSVIGYDTVSNYDTLISTIQVKSGAIVSRFAFGLSTQFNFALKNGFGIALTPGYYYSRSKFRSPDSSGVSNSVSSSQILLNVQLYYDWNRFRFRIGLDSRYELMGKNQNLFIDRRKSLLFTPQIGIGFKF